MIGRVGTLFGEEGVNIVSAAVGAELGGGTAVMALTTDAPVRAETIERILGDADFSVGRSGRPLAGHPASWSSRASTSLARTRR